MGNAYFVNTLTTVSGRENFMGQKHCDGRGGKVEEWREFALPVPMLKNALERR